jgi:putative membrane protein
MTTAKPEPPRTPLRPHLSFASGLLMGAADAVPGVSGGTIALIIGVYERFVESLSNVVKAPILVRTPEGRARIAAALQLLVPLGLGLVAAYYLATKLLVGPTDNPGILRRPDTAPLCYGFFFGLVLISIREPWRRIQTHGPSRIAAFAVGAAAALWFSGLPQSTAEPPTWHLLWGAACAVAIMLLPGVSGSMFLVIVGQYTTIAAAVHDRDLGKIAVFVVGLGIGVALFVPVLRFLLRRFHDFTMAGLTGLMAGSLRALWPWKVGYDPKSGPITNVGVGDGVPWVLLALLAGAAVALLLQQLERRILAAERPPAVG